MENVFKNNIHKPSPLHLFAQNFKCLYQLQQIYLWYVQEHFIHLHSLQNRLTANSNGKETETQCEKWVMGDT